MQSSFTSPGTIPPPTVAFLFGFCYGFRGAFACAKQAAAFAARAVQPEELPLSVSLADPTPRRKAPKPHRVLLKKHMARRGGPAPVPRDGAWRVQYGTPCSQPHEVRRQLAGGV